MSVPSSQRKTAKNNCERSREHRQRKKEFLDKLQQKVKTLEVQVIDLRNQNAQLAQIVQQHETMCVKKEMDYKTELKSNEEYLYVDLPRILQTQPEKVKFTTIEQAFEDVADNHPKRIAIIKN